MVAPKSARARRDSARAVSPISTPTLPPRTKRLQPAEEHRAIAWFNRLPDGRRLFWLQAAGPDASPANGWRAHKPGVQLDWLETVGAAVTGTKSGLPEFQVLEDGACIATLFDVDAAQQFANGMRANLENAGHVYAVREVRP